MNYKIGLTGPSGSGKTTLAHFIQNKLDLTFIQGSASIINDPDSKLYLKQTYNYEPKGHRNVINMSNENPNFGLDFQNLLLKSRARKLKANFNFVTDRTPLDNASYFLMQCSHNQSESVCSHFIAACLHAAIEGLTHLILVKPNPGWTEDNDSRVANNFYQQMSFAVFEHTYSKYFYEPLDEMGIKVLILDKWDLDTRKKQITEFLDICK